VVNNLKKLVTHLKHQLSQPLPGMEVQLKMAPKIRIDEFKKYMNYNDAQNSSVLILLYPHNGNIYTVFIKRPEYEGIHSGQISFPGGRHEKADKTRIDTALRESSEEIGVDTDDIVCLGKLSELYIPPSNYLVLPVVGYMNARPHFKADPFEVDKIVEVDLKELSDRSTISEKKIDIISGVSFTTPSYQINGITIWGATAMIVSEFLEVVNRSDLS